MKAWLLLAGLATVPLAACGTQPKSPAGDPFVRSFHALRPSVVLFTMKIPSDDPKKKGEFDDAYGTGVVIASGRWGSRILTVEHVIHDARRLRACVAGKNGVPARVVASDEKADLALVDVTTPDLPAATLGTTRGLEPGTAVGVAGFPIPDAFEDEHLGRTVSVYAGRVASIRKGALELDVPIVPGESGGPVFDVETGEVIGIAESRFDEERAIGFATPIDEATRFLAAHPRVAEARRLNRP